MRKWLNNYFEFSRREFNGLLILLMLILCISIFPMIYARLNPFPAPTAEEQLAVLQLAMSGSSEVQQEVDQKINRIAAVPVKEKAVLFYFDPNVIGLEEWQRLGLSEKQAQAILNYRIKGGMFRKKSDLQKMYTVSARVYHQLEPYINIDGDIQKQHTAQKAVANQKNVVSPGILPLVELNQADSLQLYEIRGIGLVFAKRILAYRERLGGFYKKEQLMEVFGIDSLKYIELKDQVSVNPGLLKKININAATLTDFRNHPYIRYKQINALIEYRKQHGNYSNIADLNKVVILTPETIAKLAPYLIF